MSKSEIYNAFSTRFLTVSMVGLLAVGSALSADKHASAPAPRAAPAHAAPSGGGSHGASSASHGPSTASHGPTTASHGPTTASHGPTTSSAGHTTTTAGHTTTSTAGHSTTTAGHTTTSTAGRSTTAGTASHGTTAGGAHAGGTHPTGGAAGSRTASTGTHGTTGGSHGPVAKGHTTVATKNGGSVTKRANGKVASVHDAKRNMDVHHSLSGNRHVVHERADHSRVVVDGHGRGYVQRSYSYHGNTYVSRSYYSNGYYGNAYYGNYYYGGVYLNPYYPAAYWAPAYYGWAYNPWAAPISYGWGWGGSPWYGYYGGWYNPFPVYASASFWLTDYLISQSLQAAYAARAADAAAVSNAAPLTDDVKQQIADEVKRQIALENAEAKTGTPDAASSSIQRDLTDGTAHVFVAGTDLDVVDAAGNECALSQGDAIQLTGQNAPDAAAINLSVLASKGGRECPKGDVVSVNLQDLQEMQNHMRQTIDQGMQDLQKKQGKGGLPAAPASAQAAPKESAIAANAPPAPPQSEVVATLNQESKEADAVEKEASSDTGAPVGDPPTVALGQTPDQVIAALGQPKSIMDLGPKKIYVYKDAKVTFREGKVADIQ